MSREDLQREVSSGVEFWGCSAGGELVAVMGMQRVRDVVLIRHAVVLIRHAYVRSEWQNQGLGGQMIRYLRDQTEEPMLVGTWAGATWAIRFYERHGFQRVAVLEKDRLLRSYWDVPARQIETSVVLADERWRIRVSDR